MKSAVRGRRTSEVEVTNVSARGFWYLPQLDADLVVESIEHPERYPLVSRAPRARGVKPAGAHAVHERGRAYSKVPPPPIGPTLTISDTATSLPDHLDP